MTEINSSKFGSITIDNAVYEHDVYIFPSGKIEEREHGHVFSKEQIEHLLKEEAEIIIVGKGVSGVAELSKDARTLLKERGIEIIEGNTWDIIARFNELSKGKKVAAIIHVTC